MQVQSFGMFSEAGNIAVGEIVKTSKAKNLTWLETYQLLVNLAGSSYECFGEATDTAIREMVYDAVGAYVRDEEFYC